MIKVFISWSGNLSKNLANILTRWLPSVIQVVEPYYTPDDIIKGTRWNTEVAKELEQSSIGLLCITRDNFNAPWIMFEAGALSKNIEKSRVCPILFDLKKSDIKGPLVQFQMAEFNEIEIKGIIDMIYKSLEGKSPSKSIVDAAFEKNWQDFKEEVDAHIKSGIDVEKNVLRSDRELIEEVLELARSKPTLNIRTIDEFIEYKSILGKIVAGYTELVQECDKIGCVEGLREKLVYLQDLISSLVSLLQLPKNRLELGQILKVSSIILTKGTK